MVAKTISISMSIVDCGNRAGQAERSPQDNLQTWPCHHSKTTIKCQSCWFSTSSIKPSTHLAHALDEGCTNQVQTEWKEHVAILLSLAELDIQACISALRTLECL